MVTISSPERVVLAGKFILYLEQETWYNIKISV